MKITKSVIVSLVLLVLVAALYRIIPNRPLGFAPQIAMALFGGAVFVKDKKWAFILPLVSMFISDLLYQALFLAGMSTIQGFYEGQLVNYLLFAALTTIGFLVKKISVFNVLLVSLLGPTVYFLLSNFAVWAGNAGYQRPKTWSGLLMSYNDGLPFYKGSLAATLVFGAVLFGGYFLLKQNKAAKQVAG